MYFKRMRIEEGFRDFKTLLGLTQNMNRQRLWMERTLGLVLLAYVVAYLAGEALRDALWGGGLPENVEDWRLPSETKRAWHRYSGLFALLRLRPSVPPPARRACDVSSSPSSPSSFTIPLSKLMSEPQRMRSFHNRWRDFG